MDCAICGDEGAHGCKVYCEANAQTKRGANKPDNDYLTGKIQVLSLRNGNDIFLEYDVPVCRKCTYLPQLRFNGIAALISGILGGALLSALSSKMWGILLLAFCAGNIIYGCVNLIGYIRDIKNETFAANELCEYLNKGVPREERTAIYSLSSLQSQMGKLGNLKSSELSVYELARLKATSSAETTFSANHAMPVCWVFSCYDRERAQGIAILRPDFFKENHIIKRVREHLHIPEIISVKYVDAGAWDAPAIHTLQDSFDCNMDEIDENVNAYLVREGYRVEQPRDAMKTTIPYPTAGVLLIVVNILP